MDLFKSAERVMRMDDAAWRRHMNPWSVWTRLLTVVPAVSLAAWSRSIIGESWLLALAASLAWAWINPRAFPPPASLDSWAARGILGERIFLEHRHDDIAPHHVAAATALTWLGAGCAIVWICGLVFLELWATAAGGLGVMLSKTWFVDRMAWVHADMRRTAAGFAARTG